MDFFSVYQFIPGCVEYFFIISCDGSLWLKTFINKDKETSSAVSLPLQLQYDII
jgi:hypothetical protein